MASQYTTVTVTPVPHYDTSGNLRRGVPAPFDDVDMIEAQFATGLVQRGEKYHVCPLCNFTYPESKMSQVNGGWFCNRFKHAAEKAT